MRNQKMAREVVDTMVKQALRYYQDRGFTIKHTSRPDGEKYAYFTIDYKKKELTVYANRNDHTEVMKFRLISHMTKEAFPPALRKRFSTKKS